jgi:tetratricopeptide (TPR) repeat protein
MDTRGRRWLLILDNADEAEYLLEPPAPASKEHYSLPTPSRDRRLDYIPTCDHGTVLITTRRRDVCLKMVHRTSMLEIRPMDVDHALELMQNKMGIADQEDDIMRLATDLDFMPLAMAQAASYIHKRAPRCTVRQYTEKLHRNQKSKLSLLNRDETDLRRDREASNSIISTWQISFEHVHSLRPSAADLLSLMSFFDRQAIPEALLLASLKHHSSNVGEEGCDNVGAEHNATDHDPGDSQSDSGSGRDELEEDIQLLRDYSFISVTTDPGFFEMHALVQLATRRWLGVSGRYSEWRGRFIEVLSNEFPEHASHNWGNAKTFFPHAMAALQLEATGTSGQSRLAPLLYNAGFCAFTACAFANAELLWSTSLLISIRLFGDEHTQSILCMRWLAVTYHLQGRLEKAEQLFLRLLKILTVCPEKDPESSSICMSRLSSIYLSQERLEEAGQMALRMVKVADHPETIVYGLASGAATCRSLGLLRETEQLLLQAVQIGTDTDGPKAEITLEVMELLGCFYLSGGQLLEAELTLLKVQAARRSDHPATLRAMSHLGLVYLMQGRMNDAESTYLHLQEAMSSVLGSHNPDTIGALERLAMVYHAQGRLAEAEELCSRCRELRTFTYGTDHSDTVNSVSYLAKVQFLQQRYHAAEVTYRSLLEIQTRVFGMAHSSTLVTMADLAWALHWQGKSQPAVELMARCAVLSSQTLGPSDPDSVARDNWWRRGMEVDTEQEADAPSAVPSPNSAVVAGEEQQTAEPVENDMPGGKGSTAERTSERESTRIGDN